MGILPVVIARAAADECVAAKASDKELVHEVPQRAKEPVCQRGFFRNEKLFACLYSHGAADKCCLLACCSLNSSLPRVSIACQHAVAGMGVQTSAHP